MNYLGVLLDNCPTSTHDYWRRQYVALHTSGYVEAWNPECAKAKRLSEKKSEGEEGRDLTAEGYLLTSLTN